MTNVILCLNATSARLSQLITNDCDEYGFDHFLIFFFQYLVCFLFEEFRRIVRMGNAQVCNKTAWLEIILDRSIFGN